jgi:PAS domain S-box-containing protein
VLAPRVPFDQLLASLDAIVWEADARTLQMTYVSPQAERILGYPPEAWLQDDFWADHIHPEDRVLAVGACLEASAHPREHTFEYRMVAADGRHVWIRDIVTVAAERGRPAFLRGMMLDITEQRRAEAERAAQLHSLESLDRVNRAIQSAGDLDALMHGVLAVTLEIFGCDRAWLGYAQAPPADDWRCSMEVHRPPYRGWAIQPLPEDVGEDMRVAAAVLCAAEGPIELGTPGALPVPALLRQAYAVRSALGMTLRSPTAPPYVFGLHQCSHLRTWTPAERRLFDTIGRRLTDALGTQHMQRRLRESEARFRILVEHATDAVFLHDAEGRVLDANEHACTSLGRPREELIGLHLRAFDQRMLEDERGELEAALVAGLSSGGTFAFDTAHRRADGTTFPVEVRIQAFQEDGHRRSVALVRDITERKRAEEALRQSHELLSAVLSGTPDAVFVKDKDGRYLMLNAVGEQLLGRRATEVLGRTDAALGIAVAEDTFPPPGPDTGARTLTYHVGGREWLAKVAPFHDSEGREIGRVGVARDVTEQRRMEEQLRHAQKMEAVGRLAGGLAHDFNNLLTVVNGCSELAAMELGPAHPQHDLILEIRKAGARAEELTRKLLAFSRKQMLQPRPVDLNTRLDDLEGMLARLLGEDIELVRERDGTLGLAHVDPWQFEQAIVNLAVNARDAMPDGGRLTLATRNVDAPEAESGAGPARRFVGVEVRDTGHGMDVETQARIFEPFFTTKEPGKGTGLGLAMVYGFVTQSGGQVEVESAPHRGTTMRILLPRADLLVEPPRTRVVGPSIGTDGAGTVLLVEDEASVRAFTSRLLRSYGYTVLEARDGEDGLRIAAAHADIDLLVTDLVMPHMGGRRLAELLVAARPGLPVLLLSGYTREPLENESWPLLLKPFTPDQLRVVVRDAFRTAAPPT